MLFQKLNSDTKRRDRFRRLVLLLLVVSGLLFGGTVAHLIGRILTNRNESLAKLVNITCADAMRIDIMTSSIQDSIQRIAQNITKKQLDEKDYFGKIYNRNSDHYCSYEVGYYLVRQTPSQQKITYDGFVSTLAEHNVRVFDSAEEWWLWSGIPTSDLRDGWKTVYGYRKDNSAVVCYQQTLYGIDSRGIKIPTGIVLARVRLEDIMQAMKSEDLGNYGYRFLLDGDGQMISHPVQELVSKSFNFKSFTKKNYSAEQSRQAIRAMQLRKSVTIEGIENIISGQTSMLHLEPVRSTGWMAGTMMLENELAIPDAIVRRDMLHILASFILFMLMIGLALTVFSSSSDIFGIRIRIYTVLTSILFVAGLCGIWILQISKGNHSAYVRDSITNESQVQRFMKYRSMESKDRGECKLYFIPTGIIINSARIFEPTESVEIAGNIWQRIPDVLPVDATPGFCFPDEIETKVKESYRVHDGDATVIVWKFNTKIHQDFRVSIYPFDWLDMNLRMRQQNDSVPVRIVPDLTAYKIISPTAKPMITRDFKISGWRVEHTYLKFGTDQSVKGVDFGFHRAISTPEQNDLVLVLSIGRDWVSSFVSVLIPVFAIFSILFSSIYMITHQEEIRKQFNFNAMSASSIGSGLALFVVIAIQNVRSRVIPEGILYVEKIYFIIYLAILLNVVVSIGVTEKRVYLLAYNNGVFVRYLYWPFYTAILFLVTLVEFY